MADWSARSRGRTSGAAGGSGRADAPVAAAGSAGRAAGSVGAASAGRVARLVCTRSVRARLAELEANLAVIHDEVQTYRRLVRDGTAAGVWDPQGRIS